ncbi:MAG: hypothetical protein NTW07_02965 [candidate division Zixibacteria bacterium]|nr:hypothetical protein [candidate division Zixibacteria bacterium]
MTRKFLALSTMTVLLLVLLAAGCDKEKIVESTEYVHDIEYVQLPPDTVIHFDTVRVSDSVTVHDVDTVIIRDTVVQVNHVHDTVIVNHTVTVHDTVVTVQHHYDTTVVIDTVVTQQCTPNQNLAYTALEKYSDAQVIDFINQEFGYTDGWVFYLSAYQSSVTPRSASVYDIGGYIDYWTPDWSGYYPLEFNWRMTFTGGDPADPDNWDISEPPASAPSEHAPGIRLVPKRADAQSSTR